jgi:hypothetical protein
MERCEGPLDYVAKRNTSAPAENRTLDKGDLYLVDVNLRDMRLVLVNSWCFVWLDNYSSSDCCEKLHHL